MQWFPVNNSILVLYIATIYVSQEDYYTERVTDAVAENLEMPIYYLELHTHAPVECGIVILVTTSQPFVDHLKQCRLISLWTHIIIHGNAFQCNVIKLRKIFFKEMHILMPDICVSFCFSLDVFSKVSLSTWQLTHLSRYKMAVIVADDMFKYIFRFKFHWNLFPGVQLTINQHWFR